MEKITPKVWSWASILEPEARQQIITTAHMPLVDPYIAVMPDVHYGLGCSVGVALPTKGGIFPSAVGVDIGCVDAETEYLSPWGWRKITDYDGGLVMQYEPDSGSGRFVRPEAYIVKPCEKFYKLKTKYGINQMLSPDHRMLLWRQVGRDRRPVQVVMTAEEFAAEHDRLKQGFKARFRCTFNPVLESRLEFSDEQIRVQVMVNADAHIEGRGTRAVLRFKKDRKITRARELLSEANLTWTENITSDGVTEFRFTPPNASKHYALPFWRASHHQLLVIVAEVLHWDGNQDSQCFYTRNKEDADFIQYAFTACGTRATIRADLHPDGKIDYRVFRIHNDTVSMAGNPKTPIELVASEDGKAYCFTVPSGFWVMRRGGNVVMTGNCGMIAARTKFTVRDLADRDLNVLHEAITQAIPLSAGKYNLTLTRTARELIAQLESLPGARSAGIISPNWHLQLGSLGSGNHFIEVCLDEEDRVWLFLHSGSRGVGNRLAQHHINAAREIAHRDNISLPNRDLAYLTEGTSEFQAYITDLRWAQQFALFNRIEMMNRVKDCFARYLGTDVTQLGITEEVNCHHNYTEQTVIGGQDVWLSRKGAIDASQGVPGLIPGSMGTASYVVTGKGCSEALNTAPHGAGRVLSRGAAKRQITMEQLETAMEGIVWGHRDAFLDEAPAAYKPIDQVMVDAGDLVEIRHTLRQIVNVKGD